MMSFALCAFLPFIFALPWETQESLRLQPQSFDEIEVILKKWLKLEKFHMLAELHGIKEGKLTLTGNDNGEDTSEQQQDETDSNVMATKLSLNDTAHREGDADGDGMREMFKEFLQWKLHQETHVSKDRKKKQAELADKYDAWKRNQMIQKILEFEQEQEEEKRQKQMEQLQEKQKIQEKLADLSLKFQEQKVKLVHGVTSQFLEFCSCSETSVAVQTFFTQTFGESTYGDHWGSFDDSNDWWSVDINVPNNGTTNFNSGFGNDSLRNNSSTGGFDNGSVSNNSTLGSLGNTSVNNNRTTPGFGNFSLNSNSTMGGYGNISFTGNSTMGGYGNISFTGNSTMGGYGNISFTGNITMGGYGNISFTGNNTMGGYGNISFTGNGTMGGYGNISFTGNSTMGGYGSISFTGNITMGGYGNTSFTGNGTMGGYGNISFTGNGTMGGYGNISFSKNSTMGGFDNNSLHNNGSLGGRDNSSVDNSNSDLILPAKWATAAQKFLHLTKEGKAKELFNGLVKKLCQSATQYVAEVKQFEQFYVQYVASYEARNGPRPT